MLSIIIPVYKVARTLSRCMESVLAQTGMQMEVILVDDGSPDDCPQLCNDWAARDSRVSVVHKANGGLSDARNEGMKYATGDLITFVDSDDYLAPDTYNKVLAAMDADTDIIEFPVYRYYGSPRQECLSFRPTVYRDMTDYWFWGKAYTHTYAWNKIYRCELFRDVRFPVGRVFEDVATLPLLLKNARKVQQTDRGLYYYCENSEGITATASGEEWTSLLKAHLDHWDVTQDEEYYLHVLNIQLFASMMTGEQPLLPRKRVRLASLSGHQRVKAILLNLLGMDNLCKLYRLIFKKKWKKQS